MAVSHIKSPAEALLRFFKMLFVYFWLHQVLVTTHGAKLLCGMWDLGSQTRDRTQVPCIARWILKHYITGPLDVPKSGWCLRHGPFFPLVPRILALSVFAPAAG